MTTDDNEIAARMAEFVLWNNFVDGLREKNRHIPSDPGYVEHLVQQCKVCSYTLMKGHVLYRARIMSVEKQFDTDPLSSLEMKAPPPSLATAGRLNPDGVPYFYAAFEPETAIAETRPWIGARLTVARFKTTHSIDVLDLTGNYVNQVPSETVRAASYVIGRPVHRDDRWAYLGTQYLSERLKSEGLGGLLYDSALRPGGTNIALFSDLNSLPEGRVLYEVVEVSYKTVELVP